MYARDSDRERRIDRTAAAFSDTDVIDGDSWPRDPDKRLAGVHAPWRGRRSRAPGEIAVRRARPHELHRLAHRTATILQDANVRARQPIRRTVRGGEGAFVAEKLNDRRALHEGHAVGGAVLDPDGRERNGAEAILLIGDHARQRHRAIAGTARPVVQHDRVARQISAGGSRYLD